MSRGYEEGSGIGYVCHFLWRLGLLNVWVSSTCRRATRFQWNSSVGARNQDLHLKLIYGCGNQKDIFRQNHCC